MSIRVLLIDDDAAWRSLIGHHITTEWPDATVTQRDPAVEGRLAPELTAAAFDAVLLDHDPAGENGIDWLKDLAGRPGFPPVVYFTPTDADADVLPALRSGAEACVGKHKVDHRRFIGVLSEAARKRKRQLALWRGSSQAKQVYRFGQVTIRGQRFVRLIAH